MAVFPLSPPNLLFPEPVQVSVALPLGLLVKRGQNRACNLQFSYYLNEKSQGTERWYHRVRGESGAVVMFLRGPHNSLDTAPPRGTNWEERKGEGWSSKQEREMTEA